jgi:hypothetical protein
MKENFGNITSYKWIHVDRTRLRADVVSKCAVKAEKEDEGWTAYEDSSNDRSTHYRSALTMIMISTF